MTREQMKHTEKVTAQINAEMPKHRQKEKARSSLTGLGAFAVWLFVRVVLYPDMPLWAFVVGCMVCMVFVDHEWVAMKAKVVTAIVRDFVNALAGRNGNGGAAP